MFQSKNKPKMETISVFKSEREKELEFIEDCIRTALGKDKILVIK